jgi:hypothetical protein
VVEAMGKLFLEGILDCANGVEKVIGSKLVYFGQHHLDLETGHLINHENQQEQEKEAKDTEVNKLMDGLS